MSAHIIRIYLNRRTHVLQNPLKGQCGNEQNLSQFADSSNLICADFPSVQSVLQMLEEFRTISGFDLKKKQKQKNCNNKKQTNKQTNK